jgi:hypothetical protein
VRLSSSAAMCGSTSGSVWQCAQRQCAAMRLVVYGSAPGSVRLSGSAAVRGCVWECGSVWQSVWQCAVVCGSAPGCVWQCAQQCERIAHDSIWQSAW